MPTTLICRLQNGGDGHVAAAAQVNMNQVHAARLLRYRGLVGSCVAEDDRFFAIEYFDRSVDFGVLAGVNPAEDTWARFPTEPPEVGGTLASFFAVDAGDIDVSMLVVTTTGVYWTGMVKHTDLEVETPELSWTMIAAYADGKVDAPVAPWDYEDEEDEADDDLDDVLNSPSYD